jgi:simple sugar transport system ATP-binding protein
MFKMEDFIRLENVSKAFANVMALKNINLSIGDNEIIGLVGDNGAGKSTLIKIISGLFQPDSGKIYLQDKEIKRWSTQIAHQKGIETVYQDKALVEQQTISDNIFMGREITKLGGYIDHKQQYIETSKLLNEMGFTSKLLSPDSIIMSCSGGEREGVAISRSMYFKAKLLILDEPTTALSIKETRKVLNFISKVKEKGSSCIFITHNIYHSYEISEKIVILDRGEIVSTFNKEDLTCNDLINKMIDIANREIGKKVC